MKLQCYQYQRASMTIVSILNHIPLHILLAKFHSKSLLTCPHGHTEFVDTPQRSDIHKHIPLSRQNKDPIPQVPTPPFLPYLLHTKLHTLPSPSPPLILARKTRAYIPLL